MKRFGFWLALLCFPLFVCSLWAADGQETAAEVLTNDGEIWALENWDENDNLLALKVNNAASEVVHEWVAVDIEAGTLETTEAPVRAQNRATELNVVVEGTTHRLLWRGETIWQTDEEVLGRPTLSLDGKWAVLSRTPRGNETTALGELWRFELASGEWTRLTENGVEELSPVISPAGDRVAFLRKGDVWAVPANQTTREALDEGLDEIAAPLDEVSIAAAGTKGFDHTPPTLIRVKHVASQNTCRPETADGQIDEIAFEEYVKRVVPHESPALWHAEALKAQSVASRTYAWRFVLANPDAKWHVTDTTSNQYMCDETFAATNAAVDATEGQHLTYNGQLIASLFSAENSSPTAQNKWGHVYLSAVDDPVSFGQKRNGHGQGYSQWGGKRWADAGWRYGQILGHYYAGAELTPPASQPSSTLLEVTSRPTSAYLRASALYVALNGTNIANTQAREWAQDANGGWTIGDWQEDANGSDGWSHLFPLTHLSDLAERSYRIEYKATTSAATRALAGIPVLFLGIDRTSPAFNVNFTLDNGMADITFQSSDNLSGVERIGWSPKGWQQEAEQAITTLPVISDVSASAQQAIQLDPTQITASQTLTFTDLQVEPNHYRFWFRLRSNQIASSNQVATLRLFDEASPRLQRGVRYIHAGDFPSTEWTWFFVDIDMTTNYGKCATAEDSEAACRTITPVIDWHGTQQLEIDQLFLATRPSNLLNQATVALNPPDPFTLYANDNAGNATILFCEAQLISADNAARFSTTSVMTTTTESLYLPIVMQNASPLTPTPVPTATAIPSSTATATAIPSSTATATATTTTVPASATPTTVPASVTPTATTVPASATPTTVPASASATATTVPASATATTAPASATATTVPASATATTVPASATATTIPSSYTYVCSKN